MDATSENYEIVMQVLGSPREDHAAAHGVSFYKSFFKRVAKANREPCTLDAADGCLTLHLAIFLDIDEVAC